MFKQTLISWRDLIANGWNRKRYYLKDVLHMHGIDYIDDYNSSVYQEINLGIISHDNINLLFTYGLQIRHLSRTGDVEYIMPLFTKFHILQNVVIFKILLQHDHEGVYARTRYCDMVKIPAYVLELTYDLEDRTFFDHVRLYWKTHLISHGEKVPREHTRNLKKVLILMSRHENKHLTLFEHMWKKTKNIQF